MQQTFHHCSMRDNGVATMDRLATPKNGSNALSIFRGMLPVESHLGGGEPSTTVD